METYTQYIARIARIMQRRPNALRALAELTKYDAQLCTRCTLPSAFNGAYYAHHRALRAPCQHRLPLQLIVLNYFAYSTPTQEALQVLGSHAPLIEVGAGKGYWAGMLTGADIIATDSSPQDNRWTVGAPFTEVQRLTAHEAVEQYPDRTLVMMWPPVSGVAQDALQRYKGKHFVYVGGYDASLCADSAFFELLSREWRRVRRVRLPGWQEEKEESLDIFERKEEQ